MSPVSTLCISLIPVANPSLFPCMVAWIIAAISVTETGAGNFISNFFYQSQKMKILWIFSIGSLHFGHSYFYVIHIFKKNVYKIIMKKFLVNKIYV
jgi:uncharacterized membrane protein